MSDLWYYLAGGQTRGPAPAADLRRLAKSGQLDRAGYICRMGSSTWKRAGDVRGLFSTAGRPGAGDAPEPVDAAQVGGRQVLEAADNPSDVWREATAGAGTPPPRERFGRVSTTGARTNWRGRTVALLAAGAFAVIVVILAVTTTRQMRQPETDRSMVFSRFGALGGDGRICGDPTSDPFGRRSWRHRVGTIRLGSRQTHHSGTVALPCFGRWLPAFCLCETACPARLSRPS